MVGWDVSVLAVLLILPTIIKQFLYGNSIESSQKKRVHFQKIGAEKTARCRNRQIQQQGETPSEYKIHLNKDKKNDSIH
jgi:hypothetical protein